MSSIEKVTPEQERGAAPGGPGLGTRLRPDFLARPEVRRRSSPPA